jgi:ketosteroid isomerase-like protein
MSGSDLRPEIEAQNARFMDAARRGDARAISSLYVERAWLLPPNAPLIQGKADIEAFWAARFERVAAVTLTTVDVIGLGGDGAREVGTSLVMLKDGSEPVAGKYMVVWRRSEGEWRLESDMMNGNG